jgi:putative membrane protein
MRLWVATSLIAIVIIYSVLYCQYGIFLPLLCSIVACLLFLIPGIQLYIHYKKQQNV